MPVSGLDESEPERARIGDVEFAWIKEGAAGPTHPPLVLIHGFTGHRDDFIGVMPELARKRRVIAPDLRGHGNFDSISGSYGWTFDQLVRDLIGLLDHLEIERCALFGHSMGGMLTLRFALAHPERIRSLLFMCTAPELPATLGRRAFESDVDFLPGADQFEKNLPNVQRFTLADAEHHPHQENPKAWHAAIVAHLDDVQRAATPLAENANEGNER